MKILVTGGAGFIGSNFIRHVLNKHPDYEILNLDKLTYAGNLDNLKDIEKNKNYSFVKGDICDKDVVKKVAKDVDAIINFAAETHVDRSIIHAGIFLKTDVLGAYTLLRVAKKLKIKRFIQISTDEVYGSIEKGSFRETDPLEPNSPYAAGKAGADLVVRVYNRTFGVPTIITRSTNNYGPYQFPEKFVPLFITNLIEGKRLPLYGDGLNVRDWLYVIDNCDAIDFVLQNGKIGEIYNIGSGVEKTNLEITKILLKLVGKDESFINHVDFTEDRLGHDRRYSLNCDKIKALGWSPKYNFDEMMKATVEWFKNNKWWWKPLKDRLRKEGWLKDG